MKQSFIYRTLMMLTLLFTATSAALAADRFYVDAVTVEPGETKTLEFNLENANSYYGFQADITLPQGLEFITASNGKADLSLTSRCSGYTSVSNLLSPNKVRIGAFSTSNSVISGNSGALVYLKVKASADYAGGTLSITDILFVGEDKKDVEFPNFSINLGTEVTNTFYIPDFKIAVNETKTIGMVLDNETEFTAFQTDLLLPKGLSIVANSFVVTDRAQGHSISTKSFSDGRTRITCFDASTTPFSGSTGVVLRFDVTADNDIAGNCTIELRNNIFSTPKSKEYVLPNSSTNVIAERAMVQSIVLDYSSLGLRIGDSRQLTADVQPVYASLKELEWSSSNPNIATVSASGVVTAVGIGEAVITAEATDGSGVKAECRVTVSGLPVSSITLNRTEINLKAKETFSLEATITPTNATDKTVTWTSSDTSVATVDANGKVVAVGLGKTTITAACGDVKATCTVTVIATPAESITLNQTSSTLKVGENVQLTAKVLPEDATDKTVTWASSDTSVATVDVNGKVVAVGLGKTTITAACGDVKATCTVTVIATPAESITLNQTSSTLKVGENVQLTATVLPADATDKTVTWTSSDTSVATVDSNGKVIAKTIGEAVITAKCGEVTAQCVVSVIPTPADKVTLSQSSLQLKVGENTSLTATVYPETATDKTITWTSSDARIATVDANGKVSAMALGNAIITAKCGEASASCTVAVVATPVESIRISQTTASLKAGESVTLSATVLPANATDKTVTWSSSNESVATVSAEGKVTAISAGKVEITARSGSVSVTCLVTVEPTLVASITLDRTVATLKVGESVTLTATVLPENATDKTVSWTSSNTKVATVDVNGKVTAVSLGEATITAKSGDVSASCSVKVVPTPVEGVTLDRTSASLKVGESVTLTAKVLPETATDKTVSWTSSDAKIATVDANGKVTAVSLGEATITAKCGAVSASCTITVVSTPPESITLNQTSAILKIGDDITLTATVSPETTTDKTVVWTSSNEKVAKVDASGHVTAVARGEASIIAKCGSVSASCAVTVVSAVAESVTLSQSTAELKVGESLTLTATVLPSDLIDKTVTWSSSDTSVATVSETGVVQAMKIGTATITAMAASGVKGECEVTVVPTLVEKISLSYPSNKLFVGASMIISATVLPDNATNKAVKWSSSNEKVVSVTQSGKVTALKNGYATIYVQALDGSATTASLLITVEEVAQISNATYDFGKPAGLTPSQSVNSNNEPVCEVDNVCFTSGPLTLIPSGGGTKARLWSASKGIQLRVYNGGKITISSENNACEIVSVQVTGQQLDALQVDGRSFSDNSSVIYTASNNETSVVFDCVTNGSHKRADISTITVTYKGKPGGEIIPVKEIYLTEKELSLNVAQQHQMEVVILPDDATDKKVLWATSDASVVAVSQTGMITANKVGSAVITATCGEAQATCVVTVDPVIVSNITLSKATAILNVGETVTLTATVLPANADDKTVTWTSDNDEVATVDANGKVTAISIGEAEITAQCGTVSAICKVTVKPIEATSVKLDKENVTLKVDETATLTATVLPDNTADKTVTWTSSNDKVATVDAEGKVTAIAVGEAVITATCGSVSASCQVTVKPEKVDAESITLNEQNLSIKVGETATLVATVLPEDATDKTVTWKSSNKEVATVDAKGVITALKEGNAVITATCGSVSASCQVTVVPSSGVDEIFGDTEGRVDIYNMQGQSIKLGATADDVKALAPGMYIIAGKKVVIR